MFRKLFDALMAARTPEEIVDVLYRSPDGVDISYQREKITFKDHERLFKLAERLKKSL